MFVIARYCSLLAVVFILLHGCGNENKNAGSEISDRSSSVKIINAELAEAKGVKLPVIRAFTGDVQTKVSVNLASRVPGTLMEILVEEGDDVRSGDMVARVDDTEVNAEIKSLEASIRGIRNERKAVAAEFGYAKANFERIKKLFKEDAATKDEFDRANAHFSGLKSKMAALEAKAAAVSARLMAARNQLKYLVIKSPVDGKVVKRNADTGSYINPGVPILTIDSVKDGLWFKAGIDSSLLDIVRPGMEVAVQIAGRETLHNTTVARVNGRVDSVSRTFDILIDIDSAAFVPGEFGRVFIPVGNSNKTIVPEDALIDRGGIKGVFVIGGNNTAEWRVVRIGSRWACETNMSKCLPVGSMVLPKSQGGFVEVLAGIVPGEKVAVSNLDSIKEGCRIE